MSDLATPRLALVIRYDLLDAANNLVVELDELTDTGSNAKQVRHRVEAELDVIRDLFDELGRNAP